MTDGIAEDGVGLEITGGVGTVTIDAPPVNAFTMRRYEKLAEIFEDLQSRDDIHCVILTATGSRAFCAGMDVNEFLAQPVEDDDRRQAIGLRAFDALARCTVPVIAAVNGPALGAGAVLASLCDMRIAATSATFGLPEINVGRCGGAAFVGRLVPQGTVRRMFFTGEAIGSTEAYRVGLVEQVVPDDELLGAALQLAGKIAVKSPLGLRIGKAALDAAEGLPARDGYMLEQTFSAKLVRTVDSREALRSVVEKRPPVFVGR